MTSVRATLLVVAAALLLAACGRVEQPAARVTAPPVPVRVERSALARQASCQDRFVAHDLGVATGMRMREITTYASNGAGLAANDLDADGDLDLVLASVDRESSVLWNEGALSFDIQPLDDRFTRAANTVDVDGDGRLDLVFTHRGTEGVSFWRNTGQAAQRFVRGSLPGVEHFAYAMAWGDLTGDGAPDLVTGAYDVELKSHGLDEQTIAANGGVVLYEQREGGFRARQLTSRAETLALALVDLDGDGRRDIWAANDFALRDGIWLRRDSGWEASEPFRTTSYSTMSIDWGDVDNSGRMALFTTDMNPGELAPNVLAAWLPVISALEEKHGPQDPQIMANMLQVADGSGGWRNEAARRGVDASGWSWSGKLGDLDNDGLLDIHVVNGMIAANLFGHLPNDELVEPDRTFRNRGGGRMQPAPEWGLASNTSGRGMLMADLDGDGDLDIVVNNLRGQAQLWENRLCGGEALEVDLRWPGSPNSYALGAELELHTDIGVLRRDVRSASGYLSGDPARVHFGFPAGTGLRELVVRFPDGATARIETPAPQTLLEVTR